MKENTSISSLKITLGPRGSRSNLVADTLSKKKGCKIKTNCCLDKWLVIAHISNYVLSYHFSVTLLLSCVPSGFTWNDPTSMVLFGFTFLMSYNSALQVQKKNRSHYDRRCLVEVLLFTDVARGYCCNHQASRRRNEERPPEPSKSLFVLHPCKGREGLWGESFSRDWFAAG